MGSEIPPKNLGFPEKQEPISDEHILTGLKAAYLKVRTQQHLDLMNRKIQPSALKRVPGEELHQSALHPANPVEGTQRRQSRQIAESVPNGPGRSELLRAENRARTKPIIKSDKIM